MRAPTAKTSKESIDLLIDRLFYSLGESGSESYSERGFSEWTRLRPRRWCLLSPVSSTKNLRWLLIVGFWPLLAPTTITRTNRHHRPIESNTHKKYIQHDPQAGACTEFRPHQLISSCCSVMGDLTLTSACLLEAEGTRKKNTSVNQVSGTRKHWCSSSWAIEKKTVGAKRIGRGKSLDGGRRSWLHSSWRAAGYAPPVPRPSELQRNFGKHGSSVPSRFSTSLSLSTA